MTDKSAYFDYLTRRLDNGESKNVVISTTIGIIKKLLENRTNLRMLDVGCFSGAMLNRIYRELPEDLRSRMSLMGVDSDREAMQYGGNKYGLITYVEANLEGKIPLVKQFDVIILCNVLHELFPNDDLVKRRNKIKKVYKQLADLLVDGGQLILLDGIKPDDFDSKVKIELISEEWGNKFERLVKEYSAVELYGKRLSAKKVMTDKFALSVFLTKARYLDEEYWKSEAAQLYQYFTARDFEEMVEYAGMKLVLIEPQAVDGNVAGKMIEKISVEVDLPAKNVLVVADK